MKHCILLAVVWSLLALNVDRALAEGVPTTRESETVLKDAGLQRAGAMYVLDADLKLSESIRALKKAQVQTQAHRRDRARMQDEIRRAEESAREWAEQRKQIGEELSAERNVQKHNKLVVEMNNLTDMIREADNYMRTKERELDSMRAPQDDYPALVADLAKQLEETAKRYEELAADQEIQAALSQVSAGPRKFKLGPTPLFAQELPRWRKEMEALDAAVVKFKIAGGVPQLEVILNEELTEKMIVDSGASLVTITAEVAEKLDITPGPDDPSVTLVVANGKEVEAKLIHLDSIRLAQFTVEDVECAVLPASAENADCLLGGTFLRHFVYRMDLATSVLHLSPLDGVIQGKSENAATRPAVSSKRPSRRTRTR